MPRYSIVAAFEIIVEAEELEHAQKLAGSLRVPAPGEIPYIDVVGSRWTRPPRVEKPR